MDQSVRTSSEGAPAPGTVGFAPVAFILCSVAFLAILVFRGNLFTQQPSVTFNIAPTTQPSVTTSQAAHLYNLYCAACHGDKGKGDGPAAAGLDPRPRDFTIGKYRLISTTNGIPSKADIARTIRKGMPGTSMTAWRHLSDHEVELLADHVYSFTKDALKQQLVNRKLKPAVLESILKSKTTPGEIVVVGPEPQVTAAELETGRVLFEANCAKCHQSNGTGMRDPLWKTDEGLPISSRNFTANTFKGGPRSADLYTRISTGMAGTPMASFGSLPSEDIWRLVHYVQSFAAQRNDVPAPTGAIIRIEGRRYAWTFRHAGRDDTLDTADDIVTTGILHIPAGKQVKFEAVSADVPHTLWIPSQRIKHDVLPNRVNTGSIQAQQPGEFGIGCAANCGFARNLMTATLIVETKTHYEKFLAKN